MVKTRRGLKRVSPKSSEKEPPDIEEKKPKVEEETRSKYFQKENVSEPKQNSSFDLGVDENILTLSDESSDSLAVSKSRYGLKIEDESDSDGSSSDEFMKAPISLDDLGNFETLKKDAKPSLEENKTTSNPTESGLSDTYGDEKEENEQEYYDFSQIIKTQELLMNTKKEQEEKSKDKKQTPVLSTSKHKTSKHTKKAKLVKKPCLKSLGEELGISELLAIAEGSSMVSQNDSDGSDSDNENEEIKTEDSYTVPKEGVQVTIELPNMNQIRKKKGVDMEAALKRRINLIRKENQVFMHKVHTLCWIAHGIYLNCTINNQDLMGLALSLIPSKHCYPSKHVDLRYLEKLVEWFVDKVVLDKDHKLALNSSKLPLTEALETQINLKVVFSQKDLVLIFVCMLRSLGISARLVINLRSVPIRPPASDLCSLSNKPKEEKVEDESKSKKSKSPSKVNKESNQLNGPVKNTSIKKSKTVDTSKKVKTVIKQESKIQSPYFSSSDEVPLKELINKNNSRASIEISENKSTNKKLRNPHSTVELKGTSKSPYFNPDGSKDTTIKNTNKRKSAPVSFKKEASSSDDEIQVQKTGLKPKKNNHSAQKPNCKSAKKSGSPKVKIESFDSDFEPPKPSTSKSKSMDRRVLSSDDETDFPKKVGNDYWAEVFVEAEEKWISVDLRKGRVHCIQQLYSGATQPVRYVLAWNNDGTIKDLTRRYAPLWLTVTRRQRAEDSWWRETMAPYKPPRTARDREEDEDLDMQLHDKPLPSSITEYKNHPLYALRRHLLKFEAIYPPDAPTLGFVRGEPVYSRGCVVDLHTRETWIKEAKLVRRGEEPYKIVKARPKYDKLSGARLNDLPLPLFGHWQVEDYIPPPAVDGKVPRNEYGNVELYKPCMLPPGTVHLQVPGLGRVARKLDIDCAPAVVGWEFSGGGSHPVLDGFIVCEEFKDILLDAWNKEVDESAKRAREKVEQRVYGNWKRLIKGLLIRERLKARYDFGETEKIPEKKKKKQQPKAGTSRS